MSESVYVGYDSGDTGTYNLSGGSLTAPSEYVGYYNAGVGSFVQIRRNKHHRCA